MHPRRRPGGITAKAFRPYRFARDESPVDLSAEVGHAEEDPASLRLSHGPMIETDGSIMPIPEATVTDQPTAPERDDEKPPRVSPVGRPQPKREDDDPKPVTGL